MMKKALWRARKEEEERLIRDTLRADVLDLITRHAAGGLTEEEHVRLRRASHEEYGPAAFMAGGLDDIDIEVLVAEKHAETSMLSEAYFDVRTKIVLDTLQREGLIVLKGEHFFLAEPDKP